MAQAQETYAWVGTAQIGRARSIAFREAAMRKLHDHYHGTWGFQGIDENDTGDELSALFRAFKDYGFAGHTFADHREVVAVHPGWRIDNVYSYPGHAGIEGISPNRIILTAELSSRGSACWYTHIDAHAVTWEDDGTPDLKLRRARWNYWWLNMRSVVEGTVAAGGTVIVTMDAGRANLPSLHRNEQRLIERGSDYIIAVQGAGYRDITVVRKFATRHINLDIDQHNAHQVHLHFRNTNYPPVWV